MNLREGTRRLALLLGVLGAIAGGFASYLELQSVLNQRARHNRFEQSANSDVVKQERKRLQTEPNDWQTVPDDKWAKYAAKSTHTPKKTYLDPKTGEPIQGEPQQKSDLPPGWSKEPRTGQSEHGPWEKYAEKEKSGVTLDMDSFIPDPSEVNKGDIKTITWGLRYKVYSIETPDGQTLYPTPAPSAWLYLLVALFPILGFLIPWGAVRAIGWVGAGFVQPPR